jgi:hypothetical protein
MWEAITRKQEELGWPPVIFPESRTGIKAQDQEAYFLPGAKALKEKTKATVILVGGLRSFSKMEEVLISRSATSSPCADRWYDSRIFPTCGAPEDLTRPNVFPVMPVCPLGACH